MHGTTWFSALIKFLEADLYYFCILLALMLSSAIRAGVGGGGVI